MSIRTSCNKDRLTLYLKTFTTGKSMGLEEGYTLVGALQGLACCNQSMDASEVLEYSARGMKVSHNVFFDHDPQLTQQHCFVDGTGLLDGTGGMLFIKSISTDERPGKTLLWCVACEWIGLKVARNLA